MIWRVFWVLHISDLKMVLRREYVPLVFCIPLLKSGCSVSLAILLKCFMLRSIAKSDQVHDLMSKSGIKGGNCSISFLNINNGLHNILKCRWRDFKIFIGHVTCYFHMPTYKGFSILLSEICATDLWTLVFMTWKENLPLMPDLVYECIVRKDYRIINSISTERMSSNPGSTIRDQQQRTYKRAS